jgi:acyl-CoA thioester hydrolase
MYRAADGALSSTAEWLVLHVDMKTRRTAPMPEHLLARLRDLERRQGHLPIPAEAGRSIRAPVQKPQS